MTTLICQTLRFGTLEIREEDVLVLPEGLLGFSSCKRYVLLEDPEQAPFQWLQSLDNTDLSFIVVDPLAIKPDYRIQVPREEVEELNLGRPEDGRILVMIVVPADIARVSANLKGPIVLNSTTRLGKQIVLSDETYSTRYYFMQEGGDMDSASNGGSSET
jgi:flagellar assembly factor FliW